MRKIIIALFSLFLFQTSSAQDPGYTGPAKVQVKMFWAQIEKLKNGNTSSSTLMSAERAIKSTREMDAAYNTTDMEAALKPWKEKAVNTENENKANKAKAQEDNQYFQHLWGELIQLYADDDDLREMPQGSSYYEKVKKLDLAAYPGRKAAANGNSPKLIQDIDKILGDYDNFLERTGFIKNLRPASLADARTPEEKTNRLNEMKMQCEAALLISPNNASAKQKLADINKFMGQAEAANAKFYTSEFHKAHVNQIVWSTKPLVIGKEKDMGAFIKTEFKPGEPVFGTVYLARNIKDAQNSVEKLPIRIRMNGGSSPIDGQHLDVPLPLQDRSYFQFALIPDAQWLKDNYAGYVSRNNWTISRILNQIVLGGDDKHEVTCELEFIAAGSEEIKSTFTLDLSSGSTELKTLAKQLHDIHFANIKMPRAGMSNPALESQMVAVANKLGWADHFSKALITSENWTIVKNSLTGAILYRSIGGVCTTTSADGRCYYQEFTFQQDYTGSGFSSTLKYGSYGGKKELGCDKIK